MCQKEKKKKEKVVFQSVASKDISEYLIVAEGHET